jgi:hypothetical protein
MKKSELKRIIQEELKGYSKYAPGGETKGGTTDDFRNILTTIAKVFLRKIQKRNLFLKKLLMYRESI